jgi:hypothetical protein
MEHTFLKTSLSGATTDVLIGREVVLEYGKETAAVTAAAMFVVVVGRIEKWRKRDKVMLIN